MKEVHEDKDIAIVAKIDFDGVSKITFLKAFTKEESDPFFKKTTGTDFKKAIMKEMFKHGEYVFIDKSVYVKQDKDIYIIMLPGSSINWGTVVRIKKGTIKTHLI